MQVILSERIHTAYVLLQYRISPTIEQLEQEHVEIKQTETQHTQQHGDIFYDHIHA